MNEITVILNAIETGEAGAAERLLPLVYEELRRLAAQRLSSEAPGQTLQATALVHEAYLRLVDVEQVQQWNGRGHFFAAAAEAMRRILIDNARRKRRPKHGGDRKRVDLDEAAGTAGLVRVGETSPCDDDLLELDAALDRLEREDAQAAQLVKLRYFAGLTIPQAAEVMDISPRKADFVWSFARAWLRRELSGG
jgi:RNA polymerase sigma factor (TIGR02999 family)